MSRPRCQSKSLYVLCDLWIAVPAPSVNSVQSWRICDFCSGRFLHWRAVKVQLQALCCQVSCLSCGTKAKPLTGSVVLVCSLCLHWCFFLHLKIGTLQRTKCQVSTSAWTEAVLLPKVQAADGPVFVLLASLEFSFRLQAGHSPLP